MPNFICDYTTQEEIKKLKEENEKLKEHLNKSREVSNRLIAENNTTMPSQSALYRENKKLKEENKNVIRVLNLVRKDNWSNSKKKTRNSNLMRKITKDIGRVLWTPFIIQIIQTRVI